MSFFYLKLLCIFLIYMPSPDNKLLEGMITRMYIKKPFSDSLYILLEAILISKGQKHF